jgi:hypothetical protein
MCLLSGELEEVPGLVDDRFDIVDAGGDGGELLKARLYQNHHMPEETHTHQPRNLASTQKRETQRAKYEPKSTQR